jgi:asparagine synthase (glutamine-hydrolysing)
MCGIAGFYNDDGHCMSPAVIGEMLSAIRHRGPDATGIYIDDRVGLGHVRLSIIDLAGGNQPVYNEDKTVWTVYNGEIYNYVELRADLEKKGHRFHTTCDTEVLVHLYEEYDTGFLPMLNGQWAFAIWDMKMRRLFIARDRTGVRPVYYSNVKGTFVFGSEIKALFTVPEVERSIDPVGIDQIFTFWTTLHGGSVFKGIRELPAGHFFDIAPGRFSLKKYWDIPLYGRDSWEKGSPLELAEKTREILTDAVRIRLRADVPIATYLSGGLDSSGVTAIVAQKFNPDVQTFGIRFEEETFDEGEFQGAMVRHLKVRHREVVATNQAIGDAFASVVRHCEKPIVRTAPAPLFLLAAMVREAGIKVVLTGEGADEFHGGYDIFKETMIRRFWSVRPDSLWRGSLTERLYPDIFRNERTRRSARSFFAKDLESINDPLFSHLLRWNNTARMKLFFSPALRDAIGSYSAIEACRTGLPENFDTWHPMLKAQYLEISIFMSNYLLSSQGDRMAMAHSVEVRMPFLDHRLIDFAGRVPPWLKLCGLHEKHVLKKALAPFLPTEITARVKHPYRAPVHRSLIALTQSSSGRELLSDKAINEAGLFDAAKVGTLLRKCASRTAASETDSMALAGILSTQILFSQFIKSPAPLCAGCREPDVLIDNRGKN